MLKRIYIMLVAVIFFITGCTSAPKMFELSQPDFQANKDATIAIIAAADNPITMDLAKNITEGLSAKSTMKVLSQRDVRKALDGVAHPSFPDTDASEKVLAYCDLIHTKINADYIYVINSSELSKGTFRKNFFSKAQFLSISGEGFMVEYPKRRIIGKTNCLWREECGWFSNDDDVAEAAIANLSKHIVFKISKTTGYKPNIKAN